MVSGLKNGIYQSDVGTTADAYFQCLQNSTVRTTFGYDHSDLSGKVCFGELGTNDIVIFDATGATLELYPLNLPPVAGFIGERITSSATSVALSDGIGLTITSITLSPGIWDIDGMVFFISTGISPQIQSAISTVDNTLPAGNAGINWGQFNNSDITESMIMTLPCPKVRATLSVSTDYYLVGSAVFSTGTMSSNGMMTATGVA